jgi:short-chain Z-isoprenyl diphosphate synthase
MVERLRNALYRLYGWRLQAGLKDTPLPGHVAVVTDGNRRWARQMGYDNPSVGHRHGAEHLERVLGWCAELGIRHVTVFAASVDNLRKRSADEVSHLLRLIEDACEERLARPSSPWQVRVAGRVDVLPDSTRKALKQAEEATRDRGGAFVLTVAIGYDGREEIVEAVRRLLYDEAIEGTTAAELAERLSIEDINLRLYTSGLPDPDLVIRTSGEHRMSGFLLWQSAFSELYFCDVYWPGFRKVDVLRALRSYGDRHQREGAAPVS